jgi:hypothetical protein
LLELRSRRLYNTVLVIVYRYTKGAKFVLIEETITTEEYVYKVSKVLILEYRILEEFITNYNKLFTSKY